MNGDWNVKMDQGLDKRLGIQKQPQSPVRMLASSVDSLRSVSGRLGALADQLSGIEPGPTGENGIYATGGGGLFGDVEQNAQEIDELVGTMARHLSRIERRL